MHAPRKMVEQALPFKAPDTTQAELARTYLRTSEAHLSVAIAAIERELLACPAEPERFSPAAVERKKALKEVRRHLTKLVGPGLVAAQVAMMRV
jgi:hypothetical protein